MSEKREVDLGCFPWLLFGLLYLGFLSMETQLKRIAVSLEQITAPKDGGGGDHGKG